METKTVTKEYSVKCVDCSHSGTTSTIETAIKIAEAHAAARKHTDGYHASSITFVVGN
jgi:hypothetical protein